MKNLKEETDTTYDDFNAFLSIFQSLLYKHTLLSSKTEETNGKFKFSRGIKIV